MNMSENKGKPIFNIKTLVNECFTKTVNFIDDNLRIVQNLIYATGIAGAVIAFRSIRVFTKFKTIDTIPKEFVTKGMRLRGKVQSVSPVNIIQTSSLKKPSGAEQESRTQLSSNQDEKILKKSIPFVTSIGNYLPNNDSKDRDSESSLTPIYVMVEHTPILSLKRQTQNNTDGLQLKLASIQSTPEGLRNTEVDFLHQNIWFRILKYDDEDTCLLCIVRPTRTYFGNYSNLLVSRGLAFVEPFDETLKNNRFYTKFYKRLIQDQMKWERKSNRVWRKIWKYFSTR